MRISPVTQSIILKRSCIFVSRMVGVLSSRFNSSEERSMKVDGIVDEPGIDGDVSAVGL